MLFVIILVLISLLGYSERLREQQSGISEGRRLSAVAAHDTIWKNLVDSLVKDHRERELTLRGEIQALTEALGRSKEYVQVVYPRDPERQPLESSPGWHDRKPSMKVSTDPVMKVPR